MTDANPASTELLYQVKDIVAAFVARNAIGVTELPALIASTHAALRGLSDHQQPRELPLKPLVPAVPIKKSVTDDAIVCLECGKAFVSIKRHLANAHAMTPDQYRERWSLPESYPVVAVTYSQRRSTLALEIGLGRKAKA